MKWTNEGSNEENDGMMGKKEGIKSLKVYTIEALEGGGERRWKKKEKKKENGERKNGRVEEDNGRVVASWCMIERWRNERWG